MDPVFLEPQDTKSNFPVRHVFTLGKFHLSTPHRDFRAMFDQKMI